MLTSFMIEISTDVNLEVGIYLNSAGKIEV